MVEYALSWALSATISFLAVLGALFLFNLVMAPSRLQREADERGDALADKLYRTRSKQDAVSTQQKETRCE